jgi:hypothetical protein
MMHTQNIRRQQQRRGVEDKARITDQTLAQQTVLFEREFMAGGERKVVMVHVKQIQSGRITQILG